MQKYKVEIAQRELFCVDVYAENQEQAEALAREAFNAGDYQDLCNIETSVHDVYDVTNTDDPFYPVNDPKA